VSQSQVQASGPFERVKMQIVELYFSMAIGGRFGQSIANPFTEHLRLEYPLVLVAICGY
jgi:hypothetical protein